MLKLINPLFLMPALAACAHPPLPALAGPTLPTGPIQTSICELRLHPETYDGDEVTVDARILLSPYAHFTLIVDERCPDRAIELRSTPEPVEGEPDLQRVLAEALANDDPEYAVTVTGVVEYLPGTVPSLRIRPLSFSRPHRVVPVAP